MNAFNDFFSWFGNITNQIPTIQIKDIIEILIIAFVNYQLIKWVRGTRAWVLFKGVFVILVIAAIAIIFELNTIIWILSNTINVGIIAFLIIFQPELRRALESLGRRNFITELILSEDHDRSLHMNHESAEEIVAAVEEMSKTKTGALIVVEKDVKLYDYETSGIIIDAVVTSQLIINIFEHNTPLHDGAMIVRDDRIVAATCYLPLSDNMSLSKELGTRHRAAVGISEVADCMVVVVSEETGFISLATGGNIIRNVNKEYLMNKLGGDNSRSFINSLHIMVGGCQL
ncbi:MAG: TIGR00159 family protein [Firmicutes bacterium HGW-Firmicutes-3]|nr:MAG: TIGR00159 family protein [Firmicutes bacterium HGW-Firmicutes-3]